ncbi:hypothetical protein EV426DRAFT_587553 [Tirmania nivea]|nr:hypothetical protein EV426DRAFT_587553 [Tirmania nivea]
MWMCARSSERCRCVALCRCLWCSTLCGVLYEFESKEAAASYAASRLASQDRHTGWPGIIWRTNQETFSRIGPSRLSSPLPGRSLLHDR